MTNLHAPYHPIIYVRGFAGTQGEIDDTVGDPYMGFNVGSTKSRQVWDGKMRRYYFESPLVRLKDEPIWRLTADGVELSDARYDDVYVNGEDLTAPSPDDPAKPLRSDITLPYQSIVILRYYDDASVDFGDGQPHPMEQFAKGLSDLILRLRTLMCRKGGKHPNRPDGSTLDNGVSEEDFRVYLVAHSMGGLVCRAFLQNEALGVEAARKAVDKVFTYATPHNGIDLRIVRNVPGWSALGEATNFNRDRMAQYLGLPHGTKEVAALKAFEAERVFNLIGTNPADYLVAKGLSSWAVGDASDGLVRIDNASTFAEDETGQRTYSPRAYAHRSHSGQYGIVNSEEGFQNLTRFLFGTVRADGYLDVTAVTLPDEVQQAHEAKPDSVRASYRFEIVAALRGSQWQLHRRLVRENSAIQRTYDELFPRVNGKRGPSAADSPHLFSLFMDPTKSQRQHQSVAFAFDIAVLVPDYEIDGVMWLKKHFEGGYLVRKLIIVEATRDDTAPAGWRIDYGIQSNTPNEASVRAPVTMREDKVLQFGIDIASPPNARPGMTGRLRIELRTWN